MKLLISLVFLAFAIPAFCQTSGLQWRHSLGDVQNDVADFSFKTEGSNFVTVGQQATNGGDIVLHKFSESGVLLWTVVVGGNGADNAIAHIVNPDGSFVIAANTLSTTGGVTGNHGGYDVLVFKVSATGQVLWQKCLGGSQGDAARTAVRASDGDYLLINSTRSGDGDVTGYRGDRDVWAVKLNDAGAIVWQKCFGGSLADIVNGASVIKASDNTYWIATETTSTNGDITAHNGQTDIWVLNIDNAGNLLSQRTAGGAGNDYATAVQQTTDGKLYVLGYTFSVGLPNYHSGGSVYNNNGDYADDFLVCLNTNGTIAWQKCFGGTLDDKPASLVADGADVVFASQVNSGGGDVVGHKGWVDWWVVKVTSPGTIVWQRTLGGNGADGFFDGFTPGPFPGTTGGMVRATDGGLLLSGYTMSSDGDVSGYHPNFGFDSSRADVWIAKLNNAGSLAWARTLGGSRGEWARGNLVELSATELVVTAHSNSSDYDVLGNHGGTDIWVAKLGSVNILKGTAYIDANSNGTKELGEAWAKGVFVGAEKANDSRMALTNGNGYFAIEVDTGIYTLRTTAVLPYYAAVPTSFTKSFTTYFNQDSVSFALQPIPNKTDLAVTLTPVTPARPGFATTYRIFYKNVGTTIASGEIHLKQDSRLTLLSAVPTNTGSNADTLKWGYANLAPGDTASILLEYTVGAPPAVNVGDTLRLASLIRAQAADETPADNTSVLVQRVIGSFDPNDKSENNGGSLKLEKLTDGSYLHYIIRFQNMGTDLAYTVVIRDTLDTRVNAGTLEMVAASHAYTLSVQDGNKLTWTFADIQLPYSAANEPASHGYVVYRVKPRTNLLPGDTIHNTASIYFDYNLPVVTNDAYAKVESAVVLPLKLLSFAGAYANGSARLQWVVQDETGLKNYAVERSLDGRSFAQVAMLDAKAPSLQANHYIYTDDLRNQTGAVFYYRLKMIFADGRFEYSRVVVVRIAEAAVTMQLTPNPASRTQPVAVLTTRTAMAGRLQVTDAAGRLQWEKACQLAKGKNAVSLEGLLPLPSGTYRVRFASANWTVTETLLLVD